MPAKPLIRTPRIADQQDSQQLIVLPGERDGMHRLIVERVCRPMNERARLLTLLLDLLDKRGQPCGLLHGVGSSDQQLRRKSASQILIEHGPGSCGKFQVGQEILVQTPSSNHIQRLFPYVHFAHGTQTQGRALGKFLLLQKSVLRCRARKRVVLVAELCGPLRGRNDGSLIVHELEKIQLLVGGDVFRCVQKGTIVRRAMAYRESHADGRVAGRDGFDALHNFSAPPVELAPELRHQRRGSFIVIPLKRPARDRGNNPCHRPDRQEHGQRKYRQQFAPEAHGFPASSQTSGRRQPPPGPSLQLRTVPLTPKLTLACSRGMTRRDSSSSLSAE